jgi:hypothetical protein
METSAIIGRISNGLPLGGKDTLPSDDLARTLRILYVKAGVWSFETTFRTARRLQGEYNRYRPLAHNSLLAKLVRDRRALVVPEHVELDDLLILQLLQ